MCSTGLQFFGDFPRVSYNRCELPAGDATPAEFVNSRQHKGNRIVTRVPVVVKKLDDEGVSRLEPCEGGWDRVVYGPVTWVIVVRRVPVAQQEIRLPN